MADQVFRFRVSGLEQATAEVRAVAHNGLKNGLEKLAAVGEELVKNNINSPYDGKPAAVATANLVNSVNAVLHEDTILQAIISAGPPGDVYAAPVETGTKPHFPPASALVQWVKLKFHPKTDKEALSIAFAVARKIAQRGTRGHFMFQRAFNELEEAAQGIMDTEMARTFEAEGYR